MKNFQKSLDLSRCLHRPLAIDKDCEHHGFEQRMRSRAHILKRREIRGEWRHIGRGSLIEDDHFLHLESPARFDSYPEDWPQDGDYTSFGMIGAEIDLAGENWEDFTQLTLVIRADCRNLVNTAITLSFTNEGDIRIPDVYNREGHHIINLKNHESAEYTLDLSNLPRDAVSKLAISFNANGSYMDLPGKWDIIVKKITLEENQHATNAKGWQISKDELAYSHAGYPLDQVKTVIAAAQYAGESFVVKTLEDQEIVFRGEMRAVVSTIGEYALADFSGLNQKGEFYFQLAELESAPFKIDDYEALLSPSLWKSLNFIYCERCGCPVPGIHGTCHQDVTADFEGRKLIFNGGWHDAGDLSQQLIQSAEVTLGLFELAATVKEDQPELYDRLIEEGEWGLDFILKTRLGNGYRATSAGVSRWTDNQIGSMDDAAARVHNSPYDNFLITGILAKIRLSLPPTHELCEKIGSIIEEDYQDAQEGFDKAPFVHEPIFWEHTYSTSKSLYLATMIWTSALMYQLTDKPYYRENVEKRLAELLACQETEGIQLSDGTTLRGMFYRDESRKIFQHFNHQAREHLYAYALEEARKVVQDEQLAEQLKAAAVNYADYLKYLMQFTAPYPMIASGIYREDEWQDTASFHKQHLLIGEEANAAFQEQLSRGIKIADHHFIKRFPVWFSFRGNNAVVLSMGESAAVLGRLLQDKALQEIAFQQLEWVLGKNPFAQSMMFGEGHNYPQMYTASSGEMIGEMPVGMQTFENEDAPYWPQFNNATYKEVWVGLAGKWMTLASKLLSGGKE
ncbi:glycoside hydrolase family 9 protein [Lactovum odontotermitis]